MLSREATNSNFSLWGSNRRSAILDVTTDVISVAQKTYNIIIWSMWTNQHDYHQIHVLGLLDSNFNPVKLYKEGKIE